MSVRLRDVPFYSQRPNEYSCGPISVQMFVHAITGKRIPRARLVSMCETTERGTPVPNLRRALRELGVKHRTQCGASFDDIIRILGETRKPVMVLYYEPEDDDLHYALCIGLTDRSIILNDPWHGRNFELSRDEFMHRWKVWNIWQWMLWAV